MTRKIKIPCPKCESLDVSLARDAPEYHCNKCGLYFDQEDADEHGWSCNGVSIKLVESEGGELAFVLRRDKKWFNVPNCAEIEVDELCRLAENFDKEWKARVGQEVQQ